MVSASGARALNARQSDLSKEVVVEFLKATALFRDCEANVLNQISPHIQALDFPAGNIIIRAGSPEPVLGFVFAGSAGVKAVNAATGARTNLETLRVGDHFGEVAAVLETAQSHEISAEENTTVILLSKNLVQQLSKKVATFSHALSKRLSTKVMMSSVSALGGSPLPSASPPPTQSQPVASVAPIATPDGVIPFVRVATFDPDSKTLSMLPGHVIQRHRMLPLKIHDRTLTIGMVDPTNAAALAELRRILTTLDPKPVAISQDDFSEAFVRYRLAGDKPGAQPGTIDINPHELQFAAADQERDADKAIRVIGDEVIMAVNRIIAAGLQYGASDIHIETDDTGIRVRFRTNGTLVDWDQYIAASFSKGLAARFKVLAGLDITERRLPQDGRIGVRVGKRDVDLRLSTLPSSGGEKLVLRIFEAGNMMRPLEKIFAEPKTLKRARELLNRPYGAIIVAGPTGSGKSSTLYAALNERKKNRPDTNIIMVEDPIEYRLQGVTQVQVNHQIDLGFSRVLRAMLRQDPDVIMVGEVRDQETASLALEAAMTGHLLFTSIHANNAFACIQRLENLGCERELVAQGLALVLVQRLARRLCPHCTVKEAPPPVLLKSLAARGLAEESAPVPMATAKGCRECNQTGFHGRVAVLEALEVDQDIRNALMAGQSLDDVRKQALKSGALMSFERYVAFMLSQGSIGPSEALLCVAQ